MPELPEIHTIVQGLKMTVKQQDIEQVKMYDPKMAKTFVGEDITGKQIVNIRRRGKYIIFELNEGSKLIVHLRMTGRLLYQHNEPQSVR